MQAQAISVRIWDLPTRIFHWALVLCVVGLFVTGKIGGEAMPWHARFGYTTASLLLFRVVWGLVGGRWSRFGNFVRAPKAIWRHLRGRGDSLSVGHNPLGALSVVAMLVFLLVQVGTGLGSADREEFSGPLSSKLANDTVKSLTKYHKTGGQYAIILLVSLHVVAIAYYRLRRREDLIGPMWHGDKIFSAQAPASRDDMATRLLAVGVFLAACGLMFWVSHLDGP